MELARHVDLKYAGQSYELTIPLPRDAAAAGGGVARLRAAFSAEHQRTYGHAAVDDPIALVNIRVTAAVRGSTGRGAARLPRPAAGASPDRVAWFGRGIGPVATPVIGRFDLDASARPGPLLIDEYDATTLVPPGAAARLDEFDNIVIDTAEAR